jgi:hypothetical protein
VAALAWPLALSVAACAAEEADGGNVDPRSYCPLCGGRYGLRENNAAFTREAR